MSKDYELVIDNDNLYFEKIIKRLDNGGQISERQVVISKDAFIECYERWILNNITTFRHRTNKCTVKK